MSSAALVRQIKCTWLSDKMHGGASGGLLYAKNIMGFKSIFLCIVFNGRQKVLDRLRSRPRNSIQFYNMAMGQKFWFSERSRLYTFIAVSILHHYFNLHVCMSLSLRPCMHQPSVTLKHFSHS